MRLRNDPQAKDFLLSHSERFIFNDDKVLIDWKQVFPREQPLHLEIGMGKGQFVINKALNQPETNFIGLERNITICAKAVKKSLRFQNQLKNLKIIIFEAKDLLSLFAPHSIDVIYLNFSDPWPKKRHAKNRLTHPAYLAIYKQLLKDGGHLELKTDNESLYAYSLEVLKSDPQYKLLYATNDLYKELSNPINSNNIPTEYENKFSKIKNINKIIFSF